MTESILASCILINQRDRNNAIGISEDTQFLRGLSKYIGSDIKSNTDNILRSALLKATIEQYIELSKQLTEYILANIDDSDIRSEGVYVVKNIEAYVNVLSEELDNLWAQS